MKAQFTCENKQELLKAFEEGKVYCCEYSDSYEFLGMGVCKIVSRYSKASYLCLGHTYYLRDEAGNIGCTNCDNCEQCVNCTNCKNCVGCVECVDCEDCRFSSNFVGAFRAIKKRLHRNHITKVSR